MKTPGSQLHVDSEIGRLRTVLIHSPDNGIGRVAPSKAQDWLFEDILHLETVRKEYDYYVRVLLYFLDPEKLRDRLSAGDEPNDDRAFYKPGIRGFYDSDHVLEMEKLLADILGDESIREKLCAAVCAIEGCSYNQQLDLNALEPDRLARILISGSLKSGEMLFPPIPNLIFTRDLGIVINGYVLLNKPAKKARNREALLARYMFFNHPLFAAYRSKILEIPHSVQHFLRPGEAPDEKATLEGGDVMIVSPNHVIIGCSERTSASGVTEAMRLLFDNEVVEKVTVVKIPHKRDYMHIDTLFTQVNRHTWVVLHSICSGRNKIKGEPLEYLSDKKKQNDVQILQFKKNKEKPKKFKNIESLLASVSEKDLGSTEKTVFIYSGNDEFPHDEREQWTDSCNLLALKDGVVLGYDRNDRSVESFKANGFQVIPVEELSKQIEAGKTDFHSLENTLILMPSAELSRARGGFRCMSMPLLRDPI
ncbi:arginine deiminase [Arcticibacter pallidicorallinus]|uniref:arginine deiminase n=1 Tax=Arcticibacter pallidicorallinus TaxID=1259464 RepID=A0A2T0U401_9SPHI|nr:arginine deiminase [Arcticibacter pallidicorallinus]